MSTDIQAERGAARDRFTPVYYRIQERVRAAIRTGDLKPGDRLASEAELSREFRTTRSTVRHALSLLVYEGVIERHVGRGTFVAHRSMVISPIDTRQCLCFEDQVALSGKTVTFRSASIAAVEPSAEIASRLGVDPDEDVFRIRRLRVIEDRPVCLEVRYVPARLGRHVTPEMLNTRSVHAFLGEIIGERIPTIVVSVTAAVADNATADLLEIPRQSALTIRDAAYHDTSGRLILCGASYFRGDIRIEYVLGREPRLAEAG